MVFFFFFCSEFCQKVFFDYKNVALFVLRAARPCLPACTSHRHPVLINLFFACQAASHSILSPPSELQSVLRLAAWLQRKDCEFDSLPKSGLWVQVPTEVWLGLNPFQGVHYQEYHDGR